MSADTIIYTGKGGTIDQERFKQIYLGYWKKVYGICFFYSRSHEESEEMTQQIFLSLWNRRKDLQFTGSLEHYLTRAARYKVLNYFRDRATRKKAESAWTTDASEQTTEQAVDLKELQHSVRQQVNRLPSRSRQVFELKQSGTFTNKEIAVALRISEKTVDYHIAYARRVLKAKLASLFSLFF